MYGSQNQGSGSRSNNLVVPQATAALQQLKIEAAQEPGCNYSTRWLLR